MMYSPIPSRISVIGGKGMTSTPFQVPPQMKSEILVTRSIKENDPVSLAAIKAPP